MAYTVAIIGSFQKYYNEILSIIEKFKENGLYVLSPKESYICGKVNDFVLFGSDKKEYTPEEIQMITLEKIINADVVYVYNPNGYVGRTTCYEIGFCFSKKKPLFYYDYPVDLPIPVVENEQVLKPEEFANYVFGHTPGYITNYNMCSEAHKAFCNLFEMDKDSKVARAKKVVICGSMLFYNEMLNCQKKLEELGIDAIIPKEENETVLSYDEKQFIEFKKRVSRTYLKKIRDKDTVGVLIYNAEKKGVANYIGANTLVELAMAFTWNRKIFLYNDIYLPLKDELQAWDCICLNGNLVRMKEELLKDNSLIEESMPTQLKLSDFE